MSLLSSIISSSLGIRGVLGVYWAVVKVRNILSQIIFSGTRTLNDSQDYVKDDDSG